jgi:hypothetical protein
MEPETIQNAAVAAPLDERIAEARARLESLCHGSRSPERACTALEQLNAAPGRE